MLSLLCGGEVPGNVLYLPVLSPINILDRYNFRYQKLSEVSLAVILQAKLNMYFTCYHLILQSFS